MAVITNLVGYWAFDEASGDALDSHGTNPFTETSGTIGATTGKVGGARDLQAPDTEYFTHSDNADLSLGSDDAFSWAFWWKADADPGFSGPTLISKRNFPDDSGEYTVWFTNVDYALEFRVGNGASSAGVKEITNALGAPTNWHFGVAWHDPGADTINLQVDNGTVQTTSWSGGTQNTSNPVYFGADPLYANVYWDGLIDEFAFWKKALTSDERTWLYNSGSGRSYADIVAEAGGGATAVPVFMNQYRQRLA